MFLGVLLVLFIGVCAAVVDRVVGGLVLVLVFGVLVLVGVVVVALVLHVVQNQIKKEK